ncbi:MAG: hypothetical protein U0325_20250 [Polyangiales bacterium]
MRSSTPRAPIALALACAAAACASSPKPGRDARLVSRAAELDQGLARAQQLTLADARYDEAAALLTSLRARHPGEALAHVAALRLARVEIARAQRAEGDVARAALVRAASLARAVPEGVDPALDMQRDLVLGLLAARAGVSAEGLRWLRPLDGRMIDAGENASVACGLLALESGATGDPVRALRSLAHVEAALERAVRWPPTGLGCEDANARREALDAALPRVDRPQILADTLDLLPAGYAGRAAIARRLRALAQATGDLNRWLRWLADLGDEEATLTTNAVGPVEDPVTLGLLVPLSGARTALGVDIVRSVQLALNRQRNVLILVEDEGRDVTAARRAYDNLVARGARWIIGPSREELARIVAGWVQQSTQGVELFLLAPWEDAVTFGPVHLAAPGLRDRLAATRAAALRLGRRVSVVSPPVGDEDGPATAELSQQSFAGRLRADLGAHGAAVVAEATSDVRVLGGSALAGNRERIVRRARGAAGRWVVDARLGWAEMPGTWVGVGVGDENAFTRFHRGFCMLSGYAPGELGLLAHDAARAVLQITRGAAAPRAADWNFTTGEGVAARRPCDALVLPPAQSRQGS